MKVRIIAIVLLLVGLALGFFVFGQNESEARFPFRLGLDLSGGTLLTYRADVSDVGQSEIGDAMSSLRDVIERRVNLFGVSEPLVQVEQSSGLSGVNEHRLIVELPGVTNIEEAVAQLGETPLLEFKLLKPEAITLGQEDLDALSLEEFDALYEPTGLTGRFLDGAQLQFGQGGSNIGVANEPVIVLSFDGEGADLFETITTDNVGSVLAIFLDGIPLTQPVIQGPIPGGQAVITGTFTPEEARDLVRNLNFGALPVPIELEGTQTVGAALGGDILRGGVMAGLWGLGLVALFMIVWYRLPGLIAVVALGVYVTVVLSLFKLIPVTLTAAGIAGFILSIGMAVDANILIFERFKEERRKGKEIHEAIKEGFARAWLSIRDGNLSTLITAVILFWFGTSVVEGFALTLGIGVLISMLTAISVTRSFLLALAPGSGEGGALFGNGFGK